MSNVPFLVNAFFKLITPFIDPLTRPKLRFNPDCIGERLFTPQQLLAEWAGGDADFEYVHERYWGPLVRMCAERRERMWVAWRELGAKVGVREWDVKCRVELEVKAAGGEREGETAIGQLNSIAAVKVEQETQANGEAGTAAAADAS